ncbi:phage tail protein [Chitiniphilus purpureus]|uniref:Phage tail protein n=1 Tax=Chitiniphilus purpureus TaxID=2981137 RepID=A0ABY6DUI7_9NEIS|nr:phage tail protein [Chitiniphilus sp. CD1]UXY16716.1 phage tail protein [Chitiniphilus sp. CD1]
MMMALGMFVFGLRSVPYQELQRQLAWRHASTARVGLRPARQYLGKDDETITLSGVLLPQLTGGPASLAELETMGDEGAAWPLLDGEGHIYGLYVIESLQTTASLFFSDGTARRIEFSLVLKRIDDDAIDQLGTPPHAERAA